MCPSSALTCVHPPPCSPVNSTSSTLYRPLPSLHRLPSSFVCILLSFCLLSLLPYATATTSPSHGLNLFSINANGLHDVMKTSAIKHYVSTSQPHIWVINETKSSTPVAACVSVPGYDIYESTALPTSSRSSKWGVIAAVRRDLHSQRVAVPDGLAGRVLVLDVAIPTSSARAFLLRIIAIYAPWDPGGPQPTPSQFWEMITPLCRAAPSRAWCLIGDCNLTLASVEISGSNAPLSPNRLPYLQFLRDSDGCDLWMASDDHSALTHYTFSRGSSRFILDRLAHSRCSVVSGSLDIAPI